MPTPRVLGLLALACLALTAADPAATTAAAAPTSTSGTFAHIRLGDWVQWQETRTLASGATSARLIRQEVAAKAADHLMLKTSSAGADGKPLSRVERVSAEQLDRDPRDNLTHVVERPVGHWTNRRLERSREDLPWPDPAGAATAACERFAYESVCDGREDTMQENRVWLSAAAPPLTGGVLVYWLRKASLLGGKEVLERRLVAAGQGPR